MGVATGIFTIFGGLASVVMAITAVWALVVWRRPIAGPSHHELAKRVSVALRQLALARLACLDDLNRQGKDDVFGELARFASGRKMRNAQKLEGAAVVLAALEVEVAVHWGRAMLGLVETIRSESVALADHALTVANDKLPDRMRAFLAAWPMESGITPSLTGRTYLRALELYTELAEEWLAVHVGREGGKSIGTDELAARRLQVDYEVKCLAEPEQNDVAKAREKWIEDHGGEHALGNLKQEDAATEGEAAAPKQTQPESA